MLITQDLKQPVIHVGLRGITMLAEQASGVLIEAAAGESWDSLVHWSLHHGLSGLENLALIPGTVGAAPIQNIGAYGVELRECFDSLLGMHLPTGQCRRFDGPDCAFGYRDSVFKHGTGRQWLIVSVRLKLSRQATLRLDYGDIRAQLADAGVTAPTAQDVAAAVSAIRRRKLPDPAVLGNAGSFFKNPLIAPDQAAALRQQLPALPAWPVGTRVKLSAAWMIEHCGWKGYRDHDAGVHAAHALVLVNYGQASGAELWALAERIRHSVYERFGVMLEPEPHRV